MSEEWQPIASAPKDGTHVLMYRRGIIEAWWKFATGQNAAGWGGSGWWYPEWDQPTHWMPLPAPPK